MYLVVQPNGKRSWAVRYRLGGKPCKFTIGQFPAIDLKTARERAGAAKDKASEGIIRAPRGRRHAAVPAIDLVEHVVEQFVSHYATRLAHGSLNVLAPAPCANGEKIREGERGEALGVHSPGLKSP